MTSLDPENTLTGRTQHTGRVGSVTLRVTRARAALRVGPADFGESKTKLL